MASFVRRLFFFTFFSKYMKKPYNPRIFRSTRTNNPPFPKNHDNKNPTRENQKQQQQQQKTKTNTMALPSTMLTFKSTVHENKTVQLALHKVPLPIPQEGEILVKILASPINPSDVATFSAGGDFSKGKQTKTKEGLVALEAPIFEGGFRGAVKERAGKEGMVCGNEGAGVVVGPEGHPLLGQTVGLVGGGMYAEYRAIGGDKVLPLGEGFPAEKACSWFVNPLTALGMIEYMRLDGHKAIVHTAAASQLGQMLAKVCVAEGIPLIGIVRRDEHVELLKGLGVVHALNMKKESFFEDLVGAITDTGATIAFDATGGGTLVPQILSAMEAGAKARGAEASWYGTSVRKDIYVYGLLDRTPLTFDPSWVTAGFNWSLNGFLLANVLERVGGERAKELFGVVGKGLMTHFETHFSKEISLEEMLDPANFKEYTAQRTGEKFMLNPTK